jgi:hypothetical protein
MEDAIEETYGSVDCTGFTPVSLLIRCMRNMNGTTSGLRGYSQKRCKGTPFFWTDQTKARKRVKK